MFKDVHLYFHILFGLIAMHDPVLLIVDMFLALYKLDKLRVDDGAVRGHLAKDPVGRAVVQRRGVVQDEVLVR